MKVWAVDVSPVAIGLATGLASETGLGDRCRFEVIDLDGGLPPGPRVDVMLCHFFRDPRLDGQLVPRLAPGGLLAIAQLSEADVGPGQHRSREGELRERFAQLDVVAHREAHGEAALIARLRD